MGKLCENQQKIYAAYRVANLLGVYEDCSPNGFYQRWKQKNAFMKAQAEDVGIGSTDHFIDAVSDIPYVKEMEEEMLTKINHLGIGPGGLGGTTTALAVNINTYPTHIAGLPVAINICCHVNRHAVREL